MDPSLNNWGLAAGTYDLETGILEIPKLALTNPVIPTGKQVRQNSKDLVAADQLYRFAKAFCEGAQAVFVEAPVGSQSARAMASYGVCMGVLGSLRASGVQFFELTATELKLALTGDKNATKALMINRAMARHPEANWPRYTRAGVVQVSEAKAEHMADAVAAIIAGLASNQFQQLLPLMAAQS